MGWLGKTSCEQEKANDRESYLSHPDHPTGHERELQASGIFASHVASVPVRCHKGGKTAAAMWLGERQRS
ncbi:hypothetical protein ACYCFC_19730 [Stutzerimonas sp. NM35]|uniref:hypothetical protein n=1 Tax=Stutzerimonas stutzeri TaxID=316 RepID=UPI0015E40086|nr:hypothetical protein [Stutzerimonas stutzeri]MBA1261488.1 hypothetical protein [Stutzerimonas stutzeri]